LKFGFMNRVFALRRTLSGCLRTGRYPVARALTKFKGIRFASAFAGSGLLLSSVDKTDFVKSTEDPNMAARVYDYDLIVIGGGSGGIACAKEAAKLGAKVALFDYVKPSPQGTKWGLGGTCVNVGCIPKKLFHYTALLGAGFHDAKELGWKLSEPKHDWSTMVQTVDNYIRGLNWSYRVELKQKNVDFINALACFSSPHEIKFTPKNKSEQTISGENIVIAVGGRPWIPDIPGKELAITSDDIFWQQSPPGKTLCVGASYISLETAGFLSECGYDTTVMVRSILLRGFDRECADLIGNYMEQTGVKFHNKCTPESLEKTDDGRILVTYKQKIVNDDASITTSLVKEVFDTVLFATGRNADTGKLGLGACGVEANKKGKLECVNEQTNVPHIYGIGDVLEGRDELTPVAVQAGTLLARRLISNSPIQMDYESVATTVFTPVEYGCIGFSEEAAKIKFGENNIDVYHSRFTALEHAATHRLDHKGEEIENPHFAKLVVHKGQAERVVGFHYVGPNAGEVTQGYGLAIKLGATKADFDNVVGIHPTTAEAFTTMKVTKSSGQDASAGNC